MASRRGFLSKAYTAARKAGLSDPAARVAASQAALESNYGKSAPGNNFFGIKAGKSWKGATQKLGTWEVYNGVKTPIKDSFRKYDNFEQSFKDWAKLVGRNWPGVLTAKTFEEATAALKAGLQGGYATDPNYASKLGAINGRITDAMAFNLPDQMQAPKTLKETLALEAVAKAYQDPMRALDVMPARMRPAPPSNFASPPSVSPIGSAPVGQVTRAPLGPVSKTYGQNLREAYARTDALGLTPGSLASPTMATAMDPGRFGGATISHLTSQTNAVRPSVVGSLPSAPRAAPLSPVATRPATPAVTGLPALASAYSQYGQTRSISKAMDSMSWGGSKQPAATPQSPTSPSLRDVSWTSGAVTLSKPAQSMVRPGLPAGLPAAPTAPAAPTNGVRPEGLAAGLPAAKAPSTAALAAQYAAYRTPTNYQQVREKMQAIPGVPAAPPPAPPPALAAPPAAVLAPALAPPSTVSDMRVASIPAAPRATAADVYSGLADKGYDSVGNEIGRLTDGSTTVTNKYGATTATLPNGSQAAYKPMDSLPGIQGLGAGVKGALPGMAGSAIGGALGGPLGAIAGGLLMKAATQPGGLLSNLKNIDTSMIPAALNLGPVSAFYKPNNNLNTFAAAPSGGYGSGGKMGASFSNRSSEGMRGISPGAAAAISRGQGGLY